jgi:hypothetical protein
MTDQTPRATSIRCRLGFHNWIGRRRGNGDHYVQCSRCDKVEDVGPGDSTHWSFGAMG